MGAGAVGRSCVQPGGVQGWSLGLRAGRPIGRRRVRADDASRCETVHRPPWRSAWGRDVLELLALADDVRGTGISRQGSGIEGRLVGAPRASRDRVLGCDHPGRLLDEPGPGAAPHAPCIVVRSLPWFVVPQPRQCAGDCGRATWFRRSMGDRAPARRRELQAVDRPARAPPLVQRRSDGGARAATRNLQSRRQKIGRDAGAGSYVPP